MTPKSWDVHFTDATVQTIECDNISPAGTLLMFIRQTGIADAKGNTPGYPVGFVDMNNPGVKTVVVTPGAADFTGLRSV